MSFNRLNYDNCQYKQTLSQSVGPGHYQISKPPVSCKPCYPYPPSIRLQKSGDSIDKSKKLIDISSEMSGITRPATKCPSNKWISKCNNYKTNTGQPCGQGVTGNCNSCDVKGKMKRGERCPDNFSNGVDSFPDCNIPPSEETRTSNPPCNLRGTGWNRWEWLCKNPQERIEVPFDFNISNRIIVKDNHRPCVPTPVDPTPVLPKGGDLQCKKTVETCSVNTDPSSVQWRNCDEIQKY